MSPDGPFEPVDAEPVEEQLPVRARFVLEASFGVFIAESWERDENGWTVAGHFTGRHDLERMRTLWFPHHALSWVEFEEVEA